MPIIIQHPLRRLSQAEFGSLAYEVMRAVLELRDELGRFFDEKIYQRELAQRVDGVQLEVPMRAVHETFQKVYFLDALVQDGAVFEFKTVEALTPRHEAQLLHYLLLAELEHGKLVNLRPEIIEQRFVNTSLKLTDRIQFSVDSNGWDEGVGGAKQFQEILVALLRDWGTGLDLNLYDDALVHFLGGEAAVLREVEVQLAEHSLGRQTMRLAADGVAFKLTMLPTLGERFANHTLRQLAHTRLAALLWANIGRKIVTFTTLRRTRLTGATGGPQP